MLREWKVRVQAEKIQLLQRWTTKWFSTLDSDHRKSLQRRAEKVVALDFNNTRRALTDFPSVQLLGGHSRLNFPLCLNIIHTSLIRITADYSGKVIICTKRNIYQLFSVGIMR